MKRIAFVNQEGTVELVLNCDDKLFDAITAGHQMIDATEADQLLTFNWQYDGTSFIAPVSSGE